MYWNRLVCLVPLPLQGDMFDDFAGPLFTEGRNVIKFPCLMPTLWVLRLREADFADFGGRCLLDYLSCFWQRL